MSKRSLKDEEPTYPVVPEELIWQQKIAEEMLDAGSIAYFQEEEEYYNEGGLMLRDSFLNHTAQREGERGNTDVDGRITARGRDYFRGISFALRKDDPMKKQLLSIRESSLI